MPSYDPELFNIDPYYDDFDQNKKYLKMLFRPGYALQARELTQIQTILQNQIERFGNFVFDDGSIVYGGQITEIPTKTGYLEGLTGAGVGPEDLNDVVVEITNGSDVGYAKIIYGMREERSVQGNFNVIFFQQLSGVSLTGGTVEGTFGGLNFSAGLTGVVDDSLVVFVDEGIRYTNGYFVMNDPQRLGLFERDEVNTDIYSYSNVSSSVGFEVNKSIVTSQEDETLKDPANGSYNFNAPGADRFKIDLLISQRSLTGTEETVVTDPFSRVNFIEFLRVFEGNVVKKEKYADLGALEDTLARRTYDESGNYVVDPFELSVIPNSNSQLLNAKLDTGKAYIFGYEFETQGSVIKPFNKSRNISSEIGFDLDTQVGPYTLVTFSGYTGFAGGLSFGYGLSSYYPTVYFDARNGYALDEVIESPIDSVRFRIDSIPEYDTFIPGLTLYASTNPNMEGTADAEILGTVRKVQTEYSNNNLFATIEVVPPFERGLSAIAQGLTFPDGLLSFFTSNETFYISGGSGFAEGNTSQVFTVDGDTVTLFRSVEKSSLTGGIPLDVFGSAKIKNIQILSGNTYKLFLGDINIQDGRSISEVKRYYLGGFEPESYYAQPTFFAQESPTNIYSPSGESLVYYSNFDDEIHEFTDLQFAVDVVRVFDQINVIDTTLTPGGSSCENEPYCFEWTLPSSLVLDSSDQWGLNFSANEVAIPISSSNFITLYNEDGPIDALYRLQGGGADPNELWFYFKEFPKRPITLITSHVVKPLGGSSTRKKTLIELSKDETDSVLNFFSGVGEDEGYWVSYLKNGSDFETDVYEIVGLTSDGSGVPFEFDSGQKDSYYDFSKIKIKKTAGILNGNPANTELASYDITYRKFIHDNSAKGPFVGGNEGNAKSYFMSGETIDELTSSDPGLGNRDDMPFELIPSFTTKDGRLINLRNAIDFRPVRIGDTSSFKLRGPYDDTGSDSGRVVSAHPYSGYDNFLEYQTYLSRIDKIFLNRNKTFSLVEGIPSTNPQAPSDNPDSMTLYSIVVNPYTFNENDVTIKQENNRRYTMRDIGDLEKRIEKIEYYSTLNALELEAKSYPIYDSYGMEIPKKAVLVDQFTNANSADVLSSDFTVSINKDKNELKPNFTLYEKSAVSSSGTLSSDITIGSSLTYDADSKVVTFAYTTTPYLENLLANSSRKINSNAIVNYNGSLKITPHCDRWFSTNKSPVVKTNIDGSNDYWYSGNPFSRNDAFWDFNWFGKENSTVDKNFKKSTPKKNYDQKTKPISDNKVGSFFGADSNSFTYNEKVIERSINPYVRGKTVKLEAKGLKPNTRHYIYFDNVLQTQGPTIDYVTTNEYGEFTGTLNIAGDTYLAGKKLVRITDSQVSNLDVDPSNVQASSSSADAIYTVLGNIRDQNSLQFMKPITTRRESTNSQNITTNAVTRDFQRSETKSRSIKDTLTQIFTVDYSVYKSGMFIREIDIYLDGYPTSASSDIGSSVTSKLPIRLQLKPVVSGYPSMSKVIAETYMYDVDSATNPNVTTINNFSDDISQVKKVKFVFDYPVYLPAGDYAISLDSNSDEYSVVTYILPSIQMDADKSNKDANISSLFGSLFLPKNVGSFEKITNEFITTSIHRCKFTDGNDSSVTQQLFNTSSTTINEFRLNVDYIEPTPNTFNVSLDNGPTITPNKTIDYDEDTQDVTIDFVYINDAVSPALDLNSMNSVYTTYKLPSKNQSEELKPRYLGANSEDGSRYISKTVNLDTPANNVVVRFDKIEPPETEISVYMKYKTPGSELGMSDSEYVQLSSSRSIGKTTTNSFLTDEYTFLGTLPEISSFSVKIVFSSSIGSSPKKYPKIKNLTITAV